MDVGAKFPNDLSAYFCHLSGTIFQGWRKTADFAHPHRRLLRTIGLNGRGKWPLCALISVIHETAVDLQKLPVVGMTVTDPSDHDSKNISRPT